MSQATDRIKSKVEGAQLWIERVFDAPRELVWQMYAEADHLSNWWGPEGWETDIREFSFEPGGIWHYCMRCVDQSQGEFYGMESWGKGLYQEIRPHEQITYIDQFSDEAGNKVDGMPDTLVNLTFVEQDGKTKLINHAKYNSPEELQKVLDMGMLEGFAQTMDELAKRLAEVK